LDSDAGGGLLLVIQRTRTKIDIVPKPESLDSGRTGNRVVIVSNRLPIVVAKGEGEDWRVKPGEGGLVTALAPVLRDRGGLWMGWPGTSEKMDFDKIVAAGSEQAGYLLKPVVLTAEEIDQYYLGFSNEILWPLFHDLQSRCNFDPAYWDMYQIVNRKFAQAIAENTDAEDFIWIQDYHLMLVARELRSLGVDSRVAFFHHIPFPPLDIYMKLPWRLQILRACLDYDLVGFQTPRDRNNFIHCLEALIERVDVDARRRVCTLAVSRRETKLGTFPIGIDFKEFSRAASSEAIVNVAEGLRNALGKRQIILGLDRLDYTKGIPERLRAYRSALERFGDLRGNVSMVQIVVPSREDIPEYKVLRSEIEGLVGEINGKFAEPGWIPIHYMFRSLGRDELLAYYRAADIALLTPLKDGMNLIAKEYCAAHIDRRGVLILSEFAGAATQLGRNALLVNPYDIIGMADDERQLRMRRLRKVIAQHDIHRWVDSFIRTAIDDPCK
jgi:trehalose 6-phosphate synthase